MTHQNVSHQTKKITVGALLLSIAMIGGYLFTGNRSLPDAPAPPQTNVPSPNNPSSPDNSSPQNASGGTRFWYDAQATEVKEVPFHVEGNSMLPLLKNGEIVTLSLHYYNNPSNVMHSEDIVIFENPFSADRFIKKVMIVPGDKVEVNEKSRTVTVNGKLLVNSEGKAYIWNDFALKNIPIYLDAQKKWVPGTYYLLGDNNHSFDSRDYGPVSLQGVLGKISPPIRTDVSPKK